MQVFCLEIQGWLDNSGYNSIGRNWKWREDAKFKVRHLDLRHLVWNIAVRMGMSDGYNTMVCACFLKKMFPDLCKDVKDTTLSQSQTAMPSTTARKRKNNKPHKHPLSITTAPIQMSQCGCAFGCHYPC